MITIKMYQMEIREVHQGNQVLQETKEKLRIITVQEMKEV